MTKAFDTVEEMVLAIDDRPLTKREMRLIESLKPKMSEQERELDLLFLLETTQVPEFYDSNGES